jgi:hypothetical protein
MRNTPSRWPLWFAVVVGFGSVGAVPAVAQVRLTDLADVRREVVPGDVISVGRASGVKLAGKLLTLGDTDLEIRAETGGTGQRQPVRIPLSEIRWLERTRDRSWTGALIGAAIGSGFALAAGAGGGDVNPWGPIGVFGGIGFALGWAVDSAHSKPHVRFDAPSTAAFRIRLAPLMVRGAGLAAVVSY